MQENRTLIDHMQHALHELKHGKQYNKNRIKKMFKALPNAINMQLALKRVSLKVHSVFLEADTGTLHIYAIKNGMDLRDYTIQIDDKKLIRNPEADVFIKILKTWLPTDDKYLWHHKEFFTMRKETKESWESWKEKQKILQAGKGRKK